MKILFLLLICILCSCGRKSNESYINSEWPKDSTYIDSRGVKVTVMAEHGHKTYLLDKVEFKRKDIYNSIKKVLPFIVKEFYFQCDKDILFIQFDALIYNVYVYPEHEYRVDYGFIYDQKCIGYTYFDSIPAVILGKNANRYIEKRNDGFKYRFNAYFDSPMPSGPTWLFKILEDTTTMYIYNDGEDHLW